MNFKTKNSNITKVLYIVLVLCILSIIFSSVYSMFNQNQKPNPNPSRSQNDLILKNDDIDNDSQDAILDFFRKSTTETPTIPTEAPTQRQTERPTIPPTAPPTTPPTLPQITEIPEVSQIPETNPPATERTADIIIEPEEKAIEVLSVPTIYIKPVSGYISRKHNPDIPEYSLAMNDYRTHLGIDIDSEVGLTVKAAADGVVSEIYNDPLMGNTIVIDHNGNIQTIYMNLQESLPKNITVGAVLKAGDIIGGVGETALIETFDVPHLHFEMKKDGNYIDPLDYIQ